VTDRSVATFDPHITGRRAAGRAAPLPRDTAQTMETLHVAGRRTLPPVPRAGADVAVSAAVSAPADVVVAVEPEAGQAFVARLRSAAARFAADAGAESAVVPEAVPPARHRRSRCRVVLRYADGVETDLTFLGPTGAPGRQARLGFDRLIARWLAAGQPGGAWVVSDPDARDGVAVDVTAWLAAT
jgi:hypothetical protein